MALDKIQVKYVAKLSRIELAEDNLDNFTSQLDKILNYMEKLNQLDTSEASASIHVLELKNVFRKDENKTSLPNEEALQNAPKKETGQFEVPKII
ncbi:MAG: Asp-tRNA(Asn)/Glu-tRNA(Gln) amidotransferase subunit GatC [PVC group bacterium]|nr:Asp-tRNA(Asn)/Glu-tRNA(Gln) amidotransferase subunit GatC [PVC group bacterium]